MAARRHPLAPLAVLALALQLVLSLPAAPGLVLCVGSDGHFAVESGGCADEAGGLATRCDELGQSAPCTDTPLAAHELVSGASGRADHQPAPALIPFFGFAPPLAAATVGPVRSRALADAALGHRSTILRL
jgi:hypothetical protein